ncbi:MAG: hypothetical protein CVV27_03780 [Candidatus Melainabacteria bacterium HGW-Melainabacteria-1]|nr:MAG: hypothetical protein CVV27_03780 [Candidatus Melainabacteria bacterium HGW-Melainabacteria-1]
MSSLLTRMNAIQGAAGALLELQDLIADCYEQATPEDVWFEDDATLEINIDETRAQSFLEQFDLEDLLKKLDDAKALLTEAEYKLIAYRLETQV